MCIWPSFRLKYSPKDADNEDLVNEIAADIRQDTQSKINDLLKIRTSPFASWDMAAVNAYLRETEFCSSRMDKHRLMVDPEPT
jgi:hypothetical protein